MPATPSFRDYFMDMLCQRIDELDLGASCGDSDLTDAHILRRDLAGQVQVLLSEGGLPQEAVELLRHYIDVLWEINAGEVRLAYLQGWRDVAEHMPISSP